MKKDWFRTITSAAPGDYSCLPELLSDYEDLILQADKDLCTDNRRLLDLQKRIPGYAEYYYSRAQELDAIFHFFELERIKLLQKARKSFFEHYQKTLSAQTAEKYAEADSEVLALDHLMNDVKLVANKVGAITKRI